MHPRTSLQSEVQQQALAPGPLQASAAPYAMGMGPMVEAPWLEGVTRSGTEGVQGS
jgi:hypothetical protein